MKTAYRICLYISTAPEYGMVLGGTDDSVVLVVALDT